MRKTDAGYFCRIPDRRGSVVVMFADVCCGMFDAFSLCAGDILLKSVTLDASIDGIE